ncbi:MAG TPA: Asp-tRNA(Asn)/Glu-tRNA(Gln) amidotransferase subunit GatB [Tepiditoga sp.]|nr:Asp-tRNA(Asn)/Glu-tRNA(Gln) amidotransferase subunit GatB [Tepiditoga sp.]
MLKTVIGLEIHTQLLTKTKAFCSCSADHFEAVPNSNICPVCTGQPGSLPVLNEKSVELAVMAGIAMNGKINLVSKFDRKNYFYPDLTKGYQITQYFLPIVEKGYLESMGKKIRINRIHMEEDTGKMVHEGEDLSNASESLIDYNRAGVPLIEIVTEPDIESPEMARDFMEKLRDILRYAGISSGDMEKGALRCDANVSLFDTEKNKGYKKVEIKNINSFKFVEKAIEYEVIRMKKMIEDNEEIFQETRRWDAGEKQTFPMRKKEGEADYRYFPEPDIPPLVITQNFIDEIKAKMPELPEEKTKRFVIEYGIPEYDAGVLAASKDVADYYENACKEAGDGKFVSNWIMTEVLRLLKENNDNIEDVKIKPEHFKDLKDIIDSGKISTKIAKEIFPIVYETGKLPSQIVSEKGLEQMDNDDELIKIAENIVKNNQENAERYKNGKTNLLGFFVGQLMKETKGKANPQKANEIFKKLLD